MQILRLTIKKGGKKETEKGYIDEVEGQMKIQNEETLDKQN